MTMHAGLAHNSVYLIVCLNASKCARTHLQPVLAVPHLTSSTSEEHLCLQGYMHALAHTH